jgi:GT2 family glycosyltransferase
MNEPPTTPPSSGPPDPSRALDETQQLRAQRDALSAELDALRTQLAARRAELYGLRWRLASVLRERGAVRATTRLKLAAEERFPKSYARMALAIAAARRLRSPTAPQSLPPAGSGSFVTLNENLRLPAPILIAHTGPLAKQIVRHAGDASVRTLAPGAGVSDLRPGHLLLTTPADPETLVGWMIHGGSTALNSIRTFVVGADDRVSLGILRGRMRNGQGLVLAGESADVNTGFSGLDRPTHESKGLRYYDRPPDLWLDPGVPEGAPEIGRRVWPKISVVMVSFNQVAFLEEGIHSVLDQNYPNLEFIVIDGCSTDGSIEVLERYRGKFDFLLVERDEGQADGLNKGFARTRGDILTWLNSDDLLEPGALFRVAQSFTEYKTDMVAGGCRQIGLSRSENIRNHHNKLPFMVPTLMPLGLLLEFDQFWQTASFFYQPEVFFTRALWEKTGARLRNDLYYLLDYDLWVRMAAAGATILHIPDYLACSRTHERQKTTANLPYLPEAQRLLTEYSSRLRLPPDAT